MCGLTIIIECTLFFVQVCCQWVVDDNEYRGKGLQLLNDKLTPTNLTSRSHSPFCQGSPPLNFPQYPLPLNDPHTHTYTHTQTHKHTHTPHNILTMLHIASIFRVLFFHRQAIRLSLHAGSLVPKVTFNQPCKDTISFIT